MSAPKFDEIYAAPDVVSSGSATLAHPPRFLPGPDGLIAVYGRGDRAWHFDGFVRQVYPMGELAAVDVEHDYLDGMTRNVYLVRADSLPPMPCPRRYVHSRIGAICRERGISVRQLAKRMDVHIGVARWLMADVLDRIDTDHLDRLCEVLMVQPGDLFVLRDVPRSTTLTLRQAAAYLRVRPSRLKQLVRQGEIKGCKVKDRWQFQGTDVAEYVRQTKRNE
jgi:excisionase family DNA binding protein